MAAIEQQIVITTDTKSLSALKSEIKSIQAELDLTPKGTKEYDNLIVKLRQAKGEIKEFKEDTKGLDPDQRAAKLVNAFQGMTGAIQAAAGALTLFGGNSEDLKKVETNLLGIIAIGGGITQTIAGYRDAVEVIGPSFTKLGATIKTAFNSATAGANGFKAALTGLGIGLLIAGVVLLVEKLSEVNEEAPKIKTGEDAYNDFNAAIASGNELLDARVGYIRAVGTEEEALNTELEGIAEELKKRNKEERDLFNERSTSATAARKVEIDKELADNLSKSIVLETREKQLKAKIADIDIKAKADEISRQKIADDKAKKLAEDRKNFLISQAKSTQDALQQLAEDKAKDDTELANIVLANTLADLKVEREEKLAEARKLRVSVSDVNKEFNAKEENAKVTFNKTIESIDASSRDERLAQQDKSLSDLDVYYARLITGVEQVTDDIAATQNITSEKQFADIDTFITDALKQSEDAINKQQDLLALSGKSAEDQEKDRIEAQTRALVKLLEEQQLARQAIFEKQIQTEGITAEQRKIIQDKQTTDFQAFQQKKFDIIDKAAKDIVATDDATTAKQIANQQQLRDFVTDSVLGTFTVLKDLNNIYDKDNEAAAKKAFDRNKALSIAETLISTFLAAQKAYASQLAIATPDAPFRAAIAAAVATAAGLARVAAISKTQFNSGNTGGGASSGAGGTGSVGGGGSVLNPFSTQGGGTNILPPLIRQTGGPQGTAQGTLSGGVEGQTPIVRAYVLSGDVTDAQSADIKLNQKRKL